MNAFGFGTASSSLYKFGSKVASTVMKPFTKDNTISNAPGPLKQWTNIRDLPSPEKERFRDWFEKRSKDGDHS